MKKLLLKSEQGFTLVELMVVVAIIGILSAIAVPNFKKYQAKSKQSEAKIQLAALYSAEVGTSADYDTYGTCLPEMGYEQSPRGYYIVGFNTGYAATVQFAACTSGTAMAVVAGGAQATTLPAVTITSVPQNFLAAVAANRPSTISQASAVATQTAFKAGAEASIANAAVTVDKWTIDQSKALINTATGY